MDIEVVREFVELAKKLNFTETARTLNMSQPTLSKHISALEKDLKIPLFDRSSANLRLTRAGADLLPYAYKTLEASTEFLEKAKSLKTTPPQHLSIGGFINEEIVIKAISRIVSDLSPLYGSNFLEVKNCKHRPVRELLESELVDIVFDYGTGDDFADNDFIATTPIGQLPWIAVVSKEHRLANRESLTIDDLRDETLIKMEGAHITDGWRFIEKACQDHGFTPNTRKHYSMILTDLVTITFNMGDDILVLGTNFIQRIGLGLSPLCKQIPIEGDLAHFPISAIYWADNTNPVFEEVLASLSRGSS